MSRTNAAAPAIAALAQARTDAADHRKLVLGFDDLAARLMARPLEFKQPEQWNGYIPPHMVPGEQDYARNDSPQRVHLVAIVREAMARTYGEAAAKAWLEEINANHWPRDGWSPHDAIRRASDRLDRDVPDYIKERQP